MKYNTWINENPKATTTNGAHTHSIVHSKFAFIWCVGCEISHNRLGKTRLDRIETELRADWISCYRILKTVFIYKPHTNAHFNADSNRIPFFSVFFWCDRDFAASENVCISVWRMFIMLNIGRHSLMSVQGASFPCSTVKRIILRLQHG